jgi:ABC-2 type transport system ATP-binding protein
LVNKGKKILDGTVKKVKQDFKENIFSIQTGNEHNAYDSPLFNIVKHTGNNLLVKINEGVQTNDILQHFINKQAVISSFNEVLPSLNDIFIKLVEDTTTARQFQKVN